MEIVLSVVMRLSEADGRPVMSRGSAETVGELEHVVVDAGARSARSRDGVFDEGSGRIGAFVAGGAEHDAVRPHAIGSHCVILATEPAPAA